MSRFSSLHSRLQHGRGFCHGLAASGSTAVMILMPHVALAQAAPVPNLVGACSGVSLPPSVVTGILTPVVNGIVTPIQNSVNPILGLVLPPLNIDAAGLLQNAAAGQPITLQVLNANGTIVGPDDRCDLAADSFTLDTQGGIAIGGNRITGLGTNGQDAVAGEAGSIAFGNSASTSATATNAVAIGTGARVTAANGVAIGAGSVATRAPLAGYTALGLAGTQTSAGEFSVGAPGAERQITNVAAGTAASDAATVGQLAGVAAQVGALDTSTVKYDGTDHRTVTLDGAGGTTVTNVQAGTLGAASTDAVNGAQLFATNQNVATNTTAITNLGNSIGNGGVGPVQYANAATPTTPNGGVPSNDVTLVGAAAGAVGLHNVAAGVIAPGSTDAVNGAQVYALNTNAVNAVTYNTDVNGVRSNTVTLVGGNTAAAVTIANVAAGTSTTDAVNVGQLNAGINSAVTQANTYTDGRIAALDFNLRDVRRASFAGTSGALAAAGLPQAYEAGKGMIAIGGGAYGGQSAFAIGFSKAFNDGNTVAKLSGSYDSQGRAGASGGIGYQF